MKKTVHYIKPYKTCEHTLQRVQTYSYTKIQHITYIHKAQHVYQQLIVCPLNDNTKHIKRKMHFKKKSF